MNNKKTNKTCLQKKLLSLVLVISMTFSSLLLSLSSILVAEAAQTTITSMNYYSAADGPVITASGVDSASYGFVMPIFNGGNASWEDVSSDLAVNVMLNGEWTNIDDGTDFVYNQNWGHWHDGGFSGYWFMVSENTQIQLVSIANDVELNYTLEFTNIETTTISSMNLTQGPELTADATGSIGFTYPIFNGDTAIPYEAVAKDLKVYVKTLDSSQWIDIDDNAASGWIYDQNFGQFWDGPGGYWFVVDESINIKLESISSGVNVIYTANYSEPIRNSYTLTSYDGTTNYLADESGAIGFPLPKVYKAEGSSDIEQVPVTGISLDQTEVELTSVGQTTTLTRTITPDNATNRNVIWETSNPAVATVSAGQVKAVGNGTAVITATTRDGGFKSSCLVTVNISEKPVDPVDPVDPKDPVEFIVGNETNGLKRTNDDIEFYVNGARFADLHYRINSGGQINVGMISTGARNYSYLLSNLKHGDILEYSFTYNPGNGALDTEWLTYIHGVTMPDENQEVGEDPNIPGTYENVAKGKSVTASASENASLAPINLTDNDLLTRWSSNWTDDAWFVVDLAGIYNINQIVLNWENAFARQFEILLSHDGVNFERVFNQTIGEGGIETINIGAVNAR